MKQKKSTRAFLRRALCCVLMVAMLPLSALTVFAEGEYTPVTGTGSKVGGFISTLDGSSVMVLHNTTTDEMKVDLAKLSGPEMTQISAVVGLGSARLEGTVLIMDAQTSVILK